jgi:multidrug resistance protein, MATE family
MTLLEAGFFFSSIFIVGQFGAHAIAATMIALQMPHITFMIPMGLGQAATVRVGQAVGRRDAKGAYRAGWMALAIAIAFMSFMTAIILSIPETFAAIYLDGDHADSAAVLALAASYLIYVAFFQAADGVQAVAAGALRGLNDTAWPMAIAAFSYWGIGLTSGLAFAFWGGFEASGLWIGFVLGLTSAAFLLTWRFRTLEKRNYIPKVTESDAVLAP